MIRYYRYAQQSAGQKLHLVEEYAGKQVASIALCGFRPDKRGSWRITINLPLNHGCKRCNRVWIAQHKEVTV